MPFPEFNYCLFCDIIRPELGGKFILLGFYGLAPNVNLSVPDINRHASLSILAGSPPIDDTITTYNCVVLITRPDGIGVVQTNPMRLAVSQGKGVFLPVMFSIAPPILSGRYSVRITVNGELKLDTSFSLHTGGTPEQNRPPAMGAQN